MTGFTFRLHLRTGEEVGTFRTIRPDWLIGDEFRGDDNIRYRIVGIAPAENGSDDAPFTAVWTVKPVQIREPD